MDLRKPVHSIVLDAGPLLLNQPSISTLLAKSEQLFTIPAVISEVKDPAARSRLETTIVPFLTIRNPSQASLTAVSEFAKKTGDFAVLSKPDLQVLALAYELECERNHGDWRLRKTPGQKGLNGSPPKPEKDHGGTSEGSATELEKSGPLGNDGVPNSLAAQSSGPPEPNSNENELKSNQITPDMGTPEPLKEKTSVTETLNALKLDTNNQQKVPTPEDEPSSTAEVIALEDPDLGSVSDSEGWITPANLKTHQQTDSSQSVESGRDTQTTLQVATLTNDFALQNTLLLMNLNLISPAMTRISRLKSHILRCHACFATTKEMGRQFCARCGMPTLTRVSCTTSASGEFKLHLKQNMQWNTRGDRYSIPKPVAGTSSGKTGKGGRGRGGKGGWGRELLLSEDQKEYSRAKGVVEKRRDKDLMDEDYLPGILTGQRSSNGSVRVGAGRTVNSRKR